MTAMAKTNMEWANGPTLTIEVTYNLEKLKQLLDGNWVKLDEVTAKTLHEIGHAMLAEEPNRVEELEKQVSALEAQLAEAEQRIRQLSDERYVYLVEAKTAKDALLWEQIEHTETKRRSGS